VRFVRDNLATIVCGACVLALLVGSTALVLAGRTGTGTGLSVHVHDSEGQDHVLPLDEDATLEVVTEAGTNTIRIKDGQASMAEADCPTLECTRQRPISDVGEQIICLPHRLWVEVTSDAGPSDAAMDEGAVSYPDTPDVDLISR